MSETAFKSKIDSLGFWESPWLKKQVQGHLVFGVYRYIPFILFFVPVMIFISGQDIFFSEDGFTIAALGDMVWGFVMAAFFIYLAFTISKYRQAIICWLAMKGSFGIAAFIMMTVGTFTSLSKNQSDALLIFLLGFIWLPWIEFVPMISRYQKIVTIMRLLLTVPLVYMGVQSGYWYWD